MCDISICGSCVRGCPKEAGVANSLGFSGKSCCLAPCPTFPLSKVNICVSLPLGLCMKVQVGCLTSQTGTSPSEACTVTYSWGVTEDTWGRTCRVVNFNRTVPKNSFIRLRFCACDGCSDVCPATARLIKFEIDGVDFSSWLQAVLVSTDHEVNCTYVGCIDRSPDAAACCNFEDGTGFDSLDAIPSGSEIVFGPIGQVTTSIAP